LAPLPFDAPFHPPAPPPEPYDVAAVDENKLLPPLLTAPDPAPVPPTPLVLAPPPLISDVPPPPPEAITVIPEKDAKFEEVKLASMLVKV
jgi:hypothetical protein